jgi:hypothetical protein
LPALVWSVHLASQNYFQRCDEEDAVAPMVAVDKSGAGFEGVDEYAPVGADESLAVKGLPMGCLADDPQVELGKLNDDQVPEWSADQGSCMATFLAVLDSYRIRPENLHAFGNIEHAGYLIQRDDGLMALAVKQGLVQLDIVWTTTPDVLAGRWMSALSVLAFGGLCAYRRRRNAVN